MTDQQDFCFWAQMRSAATSALRLAIRFKSDMPQTPPQRPSLPPIQTIRVLPRRRSGLRIFLKIGSNALLASNDPMILTRKTFS
jgi:hypothetical protein